MFKNKYRIVEDGYLGYEAQFKRWWWPFWNQCFFSNTKPSIEASKRVINEHAGVGIKSKKGIEYDPYTTKDTPTTT